METNYKIELFNDIQKYIKNKKCLEIGGPTLLFTDKYPYTIYNLFNIIDNLNLYELKDSFITIKTNPDNIIYNKLYSDILQIKEKYDILISSHCIEHIANPIKYLKKMQEFLNDDSYILTILPNKSVFWDYVRPTTTIEHLIQDFINNID